MNKIPLPNVALIDNTSQRLPCVLVLDGSGSMNGRPVDELNKGLELLQEELNKDDVARQRVQIAVLRFGGDDVVEVLADWTDAIDFSPPTVIADGRTPMGPAVRTALTMVEEQKERYRDNGIPYNRPWMFIITDGEPTDLEWEATAAECRQAEALGKVSVFCIGTEDANFTKLGKFSSRQAVRLDGLKFRELFLWLSQSSRTASQAAQNVQVQLPSISGWGSAPT